MLSWVREKLAEGRLRWQQSVVQQPQRNSTPSPPPLPPPSAIDLPSGTTTPGTGHHSFNRTWSEDSLSTLHSPTTATAVAATAAVPSPVPHLSNTTHPSQADNQIDAIKNAASSNLKRYSHISRLSQR